MQLRWPTHSYVIQGHIEEVSLHPHIATDALLLSGNPETVTGPLGPRTWVEEEADKVGLAMKGAQASHSTSSSLLGARRSGRVCGNLHRAMIENI